MKMANLEVGGLLSVLSAEGVRRRLQRIPGIHHADVNYVAQSATIHYDEAQITLDGIRKAVEACGYHCRGELVPGHLCESPAVTPGAAATTTTATPAHHAHEHAMPDMMHDMGHAPGMSMQDMVRDMRNRFLVALIFAIPVVLYSPMGKMFGEFGTPFGMDRKIFLFVVGTAAILYPDRKSVV